MVATAIYSVTMVLWKETTFPHYYYYYYYYYLFKLFSLFILLIVNKVEHTHT